MGLQAGKAKEALDSAVDPNCRQLVILYVVSSLFEPSFPGFLYLIPLKTDAHSSFDVSLSLSLSLSLSFSLSL
jgi:hypothetical protein